MTFEALGLGTAVLELEFGGLDLRDRLLLRLPARGHRIGLLLEVGALFEQLRQPLDRALVTLAFESDLLDIELAKSTDHDIEFGRHRVDLDS